MTWKSPLQHLVTSLECYYLITHVRNSVMGATSMACKKVDQAAPQGLCVCGVFP